MDNVSKPIATLVEEYLIQCDSADPRLAPISSGFTTVDSLIGGFRTGEYVVIGGRPGMGKTQLLVNLAIQISAQQIPVLYFTIDLSGAMLTKRFLATISKVPLHTIVNSKLTEIDKKTIISASQKLVGQPILIHDMCSSSVDLLKGEAMHLIEKYDVKIIMVDYLQALGTRTYHNDRQSEVSVVSGELKSLAREYNVCVIATSQLSRAVEFRPGSSKRPMLSDLRESGAIEQDADQVVFIYRPEYYGFTEDMDGNNIEDTLELIVAKNRSGETGIITLKRDENSLKYRDWKVRKL